MGVRDEDLVSIMQTNRLSQLATRLVVQKVDVVRDVDIALRDGAYDSMVLSFEVANNTVVFDVERGPEEKIEEAGV